MAKVMLVNPPWYILQGASFNEIPLGLCYLASFIKTKGHEVKVFNADFGEKKIRSYKKLYDGFSEYKSILNNLNNQVWKNVLEKILDFKPDVLGISLKTGSYKSGCNIAQLVKEYDSKIVTIAGGIHPTLQKKEVAYSGFFDYVVKGEGEETCSELLTALSEGKALDEIKGLVFLNNNNNLIETPDREFIACLDDLPFPEREEIIERDKYSSDAVSVVMTTRGCPYNCTYCASERIWRRKVRFRSPENVLKEIRQVKKKYNSKHFQIRDDLFTLKKERVLEICSRINKDKLNITWQCEVRADSLDEDIVKAMRNAGCIGASVGVESGSDEILTKIQKGETTKDLEKGIVLLKKYGINVGAFIMIGFPYEKETQLYETMNFIKRLEPDHVIASIVTPYPGTKMYEDAIDDGLIENEDLWEDFFHQSPKMGLTKDREGFNLIAQEILQEVERYNKAFGRRLKKKMRQFIRNPKAISKPVKSFVKRIGF
ncbi:B12-binding domain-containing radical SAM protein [Chlamydiota bacterium]